ncbi:MAG: murein hydrolase activator EnvC family protein [Longimicrobiales bacterium]
MARRGTLWLGAVLLLVAAPANAQDEMQRELRESQARLEQIRQERAQLQQEMQQLQTRVRDVSSELANIGRQVAVSNEALQELTFQQSTLETSIANVRTELVHSRERVEDRTAKLHRRLRTIYKRGPMHAVRVLLTAESFASLLTRFRYLETLALHDRHLIRDVRALERELLGQEAQLGDQMRQLAGLRQEREEEVARLGQLEVQHERTLQSYRSRQRQAEGRLAQLERDAERLTGLIADLERRRLEAERRRTVAGQPVEEAAITTRDLGALNWPVEGRLIYGFGPERRPNGVILRWNGIGIGAAAGEPVRAVEEGTVVLAGPFEGYGPSIMISHGGGYYTLYLYLQRLQVSEGQRVAAGEVIGAVGGERSPEGAHIEFQVRAPVNGAPVAVDPLTWLRGRPSS